MILTCRSGHAVRPATGFSTGGDDAFGRRDHEIGLFAVVDALGHGPDAALSAKRVRETLGERFEAPLSQVFEACDRALVGMRGAVLSALRVTPTEVTFAGIGNVELIAPEGVNRPPCAAGVIGRGLRSVREWTLPVKGKQRWLLVSDGVRQRDLNEALTASALLHPVDAASMVLEMAGRHDDDASVLVLDVWGD